MARKVEVQILGDARSLERSFASARSSALGLNSDLGKLRVGFGSLVKSFVVIAALEKAFQGLESAVHSGISEFKETTQIQAQTAAALKSTGAISGETAKQIHALSLELSNLSGQSDESIQSAENLLLAFTNIRNSAGKGNDIFTQATKIVVDFAARTGKDAPAAAILFGKALQDPAKRVGILARAGVVLTKSQTEFLKKTEQSKGILAAQKVLIHDLTVRYQGAAAAAGKTLPGALNILKQRFRDLAGEGVGQVAPALTRAAVGLAGFVVDLTNAQGASAKFKIAVAGLKTVASDVFDKIRSAVNRIDWSKLFGELRGAARSAQNSLGDAIAKVDWNKVWSRAKGIADGLQARLEQINWAKIGGKIGDGIAAAIKVAVPAAAKLADKLTAVIGKIDWEKVGKIVGPGLATAIVVAFTTLTDPAFWARHWDLALAIAVTAFSGSLGKIGGKLLEPVARLGSKFAGDIALSIAGAVEKVAPRLAEPILTALQKLPGLAERALAKLVAPVQRLFARLGGVAKFAVKVLGIKTAIDAVAGFIKHIAGVIANGLDAAWKTLEQKAIKAALAIVEPFTHLPKWLGGGPFQQIKTDLEQTLTDMQTSGATGGKAVGTAVVNGMTVGVQNAASLFAAAVSNVATNALAGINVNDAITEQLNQNAGRAAAAAAAAVNTTTTTPPLKPPGADLGPQGSDKKRKGITADQRNTFFDNRISRLLDRVQDLPIKQQIAKLKSIKALVAQRLAATKDVTRRLTLEDKLVEIDRTIKSTGATVVQNANDLFDSAISRALNRVQFEPLKKQIATLTTIGGIITRRIAATKDVQRKKDLEDQLLSVNQQKKQDKQQLADDFIAGLQLNVDKAAVTRGFGDDLKTLAALKAAILKEIKTQGDSVALEQQLFGVTQQISQVHAQVGQSILDGLDFKVTKAEATKSQVDDLATLEKLKKGIEKQIKTSGDTLTLEQQLFDTNQKILAARQTQAQNANDARNARQFKALGLTANGDARVPGVKALKGELGKVTDAISGTFLDTSKTKGILTHLRQVLSGGMGAIGRDVRDKVKGILDDLNNQLKNHAGDQTKFRHISSAKFVASLGLNLTPEQTRAVRSKVAQIGAGGAVPQRAAAFGLAGGKALPAAKTLPVAPRVKTPVPPPSPRALQSASDPWKSRSLQGVTEKPMSIVDQVFKRYPGLAKYRSLFAFKQTGPSPKGYQSESYQKGDTESFDPAKRAILLYGKKNKPADVAGEIVSHFLTTGLSPGLTKIYKRFTKSITPSEMAFLKRDYKAEGEGRPFKQYEKMSGLPALFRGSLFGQLDSGDVTYTKAQMRMFANAKKLLVPPPVHQRTLQTAGTGGINFNGPVTMNNYGVTDVGALETQLQKRAKARPQQRRGPYAGRH